MQCTQYPEVVLKLTSLLETIYFYFRFFHIPSNNYIQRPLLQIIRRNFRAVTRNVYHKTGPCNAKPVKNSLFYKFSKFAMLAGATTLVIFRNETLCKAKTTRMAGYGIMSDKQTKFDWRQFWQYLKPYLGYFISAIIVS